MPTSMEGVGTTSTDILTGGEASTCTPTGRISMPRSTLGTSAVKSMTTAE